MDTKLVNQMAHCEGKNNDNNNNNDNKEILHNGEKSLTQTKG